MKSIALFVTLASVAACGISQNTTHLTDFFQNKVFSKDKRPVDGVLTEITITNVGSKKYNISLLTALVDRQTGKPSENLEILGTSLDCTFGDTIILCEKDDRPVDGVLTEVKLVKDATTWTATVRTALVNRQTGEPGEETKEIGSGLVEKK
jgi:hypothetical protein